MHRLHSVRQRRRAEAQELRPLMQTPSISQNPKPRFGGRPWPHTTSVCLFPPSLTLFARFHQVGFESDKLRVYLIRAGWNCGESLNNSALRSRSTHCVRASEQTFLIVGRVQDAGHQIRTSGWAVIRAKGEGRKLGRSKPNFSLPTACAAMRK